MSNDGDDYEVGYKKPPKEKRFKKGQSGNPSGRPKKKKPAQNQSDPASVLKRADERKIDLNGREYTPFELEVMALQAKAFKGCVAASRQLKSLRKEMGLLRPQPARTGGVLVLPAGPANIEDFEAAAYRQQAQFRTHARGSQSRDAMGNGEEDDES